MLENNQKPNEVNKIIAKALLIIAREMVVKFSNMATCLLVKDKIEEIEGLMGDVDSCD